MTHPSEVQEGRGVIETTPARVCLTDRVKFRPRRDPGIRESEAA